MPFKNEALPYFANAIDTLSRVGEQKRQEQRQFQLVNEERVFNRAKEQEQRQYQQQQAEQNALNDRAQQEWKFQHDANMSILNDPQQDPTVKQHAADALMKLRQIGLSKGFSASSLGNVPVTQPNELLYPPSPQVTKWLPDVAKKYPQGFTLAQSKQFQDDANQLQIAEDNRLARLAMQREGALNRKAATGMTEPEDWRQTLDQVNKGMLPPDAIQLTSFRDRSSMTRQAAAMGIDMVKLGLDWNAIKKQVQSRNAPAFAVQKQSIDYAKSFIPQIRQMNESLNRSDWQLLNKVNWNLALKTGMMPKDNERVAAYVNAVYNLKRDLDRVYSYGNVAHKDAEEQMSQILDPFLNKRVTAATLDQFEREINLRSQALSNFSAITAGETSDAYQRFNNSGESISAGNTPTTGATAATSGATASQKPVDDATTNYLKDLGF
jgi:hypothetical protein